MMEKMILSKLSNLRNIRILKPLLLAVYFVLLLFICYHIIYANRIIPGVMVGNTKVGGKTYNEAKNLLEKNNVQDQVLKLTFDAEEYTIKPSDIELEYDWDGSVSRAYEIGRSGNFIKDTKDKLAGLVKTLYIDAYYDYNDEALSNIFSAIKAETNVEANNADYVLENGKVIIFSSKEGKKVVDEGLYNTVINSLNRIEFSPKKLPTKIIKPKIVEADLQPFLDQVNKIASSKITISNGKKQWVLNSEQLLDFVTVKEENTVVELRLDEPKFEALAESIAAEVNQLPRGQVTSMEGNKVAGFEIIREGSELDTEKLIDNFKQALFKGSMQVELPMSAIKGPASKETYGILELLGEGSSHYKGSATGRVNNLTLAAERTNGVLVAPGATYSLNNSIGEISAATGYNTAYIIKDGRTVLGEGGGVCQTSTTLFRAILNSGLPVTMRYPHAYRVSYYEQDMPVGFDAAIFQPSWDFQFKNDTKNYVMVQSYANPEDSLLTFKIYGTSDGRKVEIPEPIVTNQSPPPPALYQDDPTLAKGVVKQVDFPAWGASVKLTRKVTRGDEVLYEDVFTSRYQPWRAVYLVGTKK